MSFSKGSAVNAVWCAPHPALPTGTALPPLSMFKSFCSRIGLTCDIRRETA
jgi:hypothetical protein